MLKLFISCFWRQYFSTTFFSVGVPFPKNFMSVAKTILKRLFRVYAHIYHQHFDSVMQLQEEAHLNTSFKHFIFFVQVRLLHWCVRLKCLKLHLVMYWWEIFLVTFFALVQLLWKCITSLGFFPQVQVWMSINIMTTVHVEFWDPCLTPCNIFYTVG